MSPRFPERVWLLTHPSWTDGHTEIIRNVRRASSYAADGYTVVEYAKKTPTEGGDDGSGA